MPQAMSKPVEVRYFKVTTWQEMTQAWNSAPSIGYSGTVEHRLDGSKYLNLERQATGEKLVVRAGSVLIWNGNTLADIPAEEFDANYTVINKTQAATKAVEVTYFPVDTWEEMAQTWHDALSLGYYGQLESRLDGTLTLRLTGPTQPRVDARLGENLIWNGKTLAVLNDEDFAAGYTPL